jgi:hypothetical protein
MDFQGQYQMETGLTDVGSTGVVTAPRLIPFHPIEVYRLGIIGLNIQATITIDVEVGTQGGAYTAKDTVIFPLMAAGGVGFFHVLDEPLIVIPGEELVLNVTTASASDFCWTFLHYRPLGFARVGAVQKGDSSLFPVTGTPPTTPFVDTRMILDRLVNLTEVTAT